MLRFNILLFALLMTANCFAAQSTIGLNYISWKEFVDLKNTTNVTDQAFGNFVGNGLIYEWKKYPWENWGYTIEAGLMGGMTAAGGSQSVLTYQTGNIQWSGALLSTRIANRVSDQISISTGLFGFYRQLDLPKIAGVSATSGSPTNFGLNLDMSFHFNQNWEMRQTIGALGSKASTFWSFGIGYIL